MSCVDLSSSRSHRAGAEPILQDPHQAVWQAGIILGGTIPPGRGKGHHHRGWGSWRFRRPGSRGADRCRNGSRRGSISSEPSSPILASLPASVLHPRPNHPCRVRRGAPLLAELVPARAARQPARRLRPGRLPALPDPHPAAAVRPRRPCLVTRPTTSVQGRALGRANEQVGGGWPRSPSTPTTSSWRPSTRSASGSRSWRSSRSR